MIYVCMLYNGHDFDKPNARYDSDDVIALGRMLRRVGNDTLICVHDGSFKGAPHISEIVLPEQAQKMHGFMPKLWLWSAAFSRMINAPFCFLDLDCVVLEDPSPLYNVKFPVSIWNFAKQEPYNTSLFFRQPYALTEVWTLASGENGPAIIERAKREWPRWNGDQSFLGWYIREIDLTHTVHTTIRTISPDDGVRNMSGQWLDKSPPKDTKAVFFCGPKKPTDFGDVQWIKKALEK